MPDQNDVSTVPLVKAALVGLMQAEPGLAAVRVDYGDPGPARIEREHLFLGGTVQAEESWAPFGRLSRDEKYSLELFIHAAKPAGTQRDATERVYELFGVVSRLVRPYARTATLIAPNLTQGGISVRPTGHREFAADAGYVAFLTGLFDIHARI